MAAAPPCGGHLVHRASNPPHVQSERDVRHSPPRPDPVRPPRLRPVRRGPRPARGAARRARRRRPPDTDPPGDATSSPIRRSSARSSPSIPVVELGDRRLETVTSAAKLRRLLADVLDGAPAARMTTGTDLTILVALAAGSSASSRRACCRSCPPTSGSSPRSPSPAAAAGRPPVAGWPSATPSPTSRGSVPCSRCSGVTATYAAAGFAAYIPTAARSSAASCSSCSGLNLAGILRIGALERTWRPLDAGAAGSLATTTGSIALAAPGGGGARPAASATDSAAGSSARTAAGSRRSASARSSRSAGRRASASSWAGSWRWPSTTGTVAQGAILLIAYTLGLGLPFIAIAVVYDRAPGLLRPLVRHGRAVSLIGGLLVVADRRRDDLRLAGRSCRASSRSSRPSEGSVTEERPGFTHRRERHGLIGPFSGRQLLIGAVVDPGRGRRRGRRSRRRSATPSIGPNMVNPQATPFLIGEAPAEGLRAGADRPRAGGRARRRLDLPADRPRRPARSAWPTCAARSCGSTSGQLVPAVPAGDADPARARRDVPRPRPRDRRHQRPGDDPGRRRGLRRALRARLHDRLRRLRAHPADVPGVRACRPSSSSTPNGVIELVVNGPVDEAGASALIESMLPPAPSRRRAPSQASRTAGHDAADVERGGRPSSSGRRPLPLEGRPMRYILMTYNGARSTSRPGRMHARGAAGRGRPDGRLVPGARREGRIVGGEELGYPRRREDRARRGVTDGPFIETKELLGGFIVLEVPDEATALEIAAAGRASPGRATRSRSGRSATRRPKPGCAEPAALDRLEPEAVAVALEAARPAASTRATARSASPRRRPGRTARPCGAPKSSGKSSNAVTQRGIRAPRPHEQVAEEGHGPRPIPGAAHDHRLVARPSGRRSARP